MNKKKKSLFQVISDVGNNIVIAMLIFCFSFFLLVKIVTVLDNETHIVGSNFVVAWIIIIIISVSSCIFAIIVGNKVSPWLLNKLAKKLDFPLSQVPDSIFIVIFIILIFFSVLMCVDSLKNDLKISWLPNSGDVAALCSVCVASIAYLGNSNSKFVISVADESGLISEEDTIQSESFDFWVTNAGGRGGDIKYLGWCLPEVREKIVLKWQINKNTIHSFNSFDTFNESTLNDFIHIDSGKRYDFGKIKFNKKDQLPEIFYLVFVDSIGKIIFRRIEWSISKESNRISEHEMKKDNLKKMDLKNKIRRCTRWEWASMSVWTLCISLAFISIFNFMNSITGFKNFKLERIGFSWVDKDYYSGLFLLLTSIWMGIVVHVGLAKYKKANLTDLFIVNCIMIELIITLLKPTVDMLKIAPHPLTASGVTILITIAWLITSTIMYKRDKKHIHHEK